MDFFCEISTLSRCALTQLILPSDADCDIYKLPRLACDYVDGLCSGCLFQRFSSDVLAVDLKCIREFFLPQFIVKSVEKEPQVAYNIFHCGFEVHEETFSYLIAYGLSNVLLDEDAVLKRLKTMDWGSALKDTWKRLCCLLKYATFRNITGNKWRSVFAVAPSDGNNYSEMVKELGPRFFWPVNDVEGLTLSENNIVQVSKNLLMAENCKREEAIQAQPEFIRETLRHVHVLR